MEVRAYAPGEVIVTEGAPGDSMFALAEGTASVMRGWGTSEARKVASVATGDVFGETAMVSGAPRLATVVADGDAVALQFPRAAVQKVVDKHPPVAQALERFYRQRLLANILRASPILRALPEQEKAALAARFKAVVFADGDRIISEGQPPENVYLLLRGTCAVSHQRGARYPDLREGDLFGEVAALKGGGATATVVAQGQALALELAAPEFLGPVAKYPQAMQAVEALVEQRLARTAALDGDARV
jgi:CRP-like cAMP-binding protein